MTYAATPPGAWQGYAVVPQPGMAPVQRHSSHLKIIGLLALTVVLVIGVVVGVSAWLTPAQTSIVCPPDCGSPPSVRPVSARPRFIGPGGAYSFEYLPSQGALTATSDGTGVTETADGQVKGTVRIFGADAQGRTAQQLARSVVNQAYPDARLAYAIPDAFVGYELGYGEVDDVQVQSSNGGYARDRLVIMVAVKNGVALVGEATGEYHAFTQDDTNHGSGVGLLVAMDLLDPLINTCSWRGDPPR